MAKRQSSAAVEAEVGEPVEAPIAKYAPRPYAEAVSEEHAEFLRNMGVEIE